MDQSNCEFFIILAPKVNYDLFEERISNGTQAAVGQFPFMVSIADKEAHICGGFIYNEKFVVTVASCVYEFVGYVRNL